MGKSPEAYRRFWDKFSPELRTNGWPPAASPYMRNYMRFFPSSRPRVLHYSASFCRPNRLRAEVCIENSKAETNKAVFDELHRRKKRIEATVGECLVWERLDNDNIKRSRISLYFGGFILITEEERWPEAREWLIDALGRMRDAFKPVLKKLYP